MAFFLDEAGKGRFGGAIQGIAGKVTNGFGV